MPDLYLGSRAHQLRQLPIGQTAIVRMSTVQVDQKGRVWLRPDERLSDDADLQSSGRAGTEDWCRCWVLTLPILADENLPKFEPGKVYWIVSRYLPVTEVREVHIKPKVSKSTD
jgi:hypothetical protein